MKLNVYGVPTEVERIGFTSTHRPGEPIGPGDTNNDVYVDADGRKFVEVHITTSWREYDESKDGPIWTEDLWEFVLKNTPKKTLSVGGPAVLRLVPGMNNDNPIVVVFDNEEDAMSYWKTDDVFDGQPDPSEGYNHLHLDGDVNVTWFAHVDVKHMSHEKLQDFIDERYAGWALTNNWLKLDENAYRFVCGDDDADERYCEWVEETLGIKQDVSLDGFCAGCDVWHEPEACMLCRMFNERRG